MADNDDEAFRGILETAIIVAIVLSLAIAESSVSKMAYDTAPHLTHAARHDHPSADTDEPYDALSHAHRLDGS